MPLARLAKLQTEASVTARAFCRDQSMTALFSIGLVLDLTPHHHFLHITWRHVNRFNVLEAYYDCC